MSTNISIEDVREILTQTKHPVIECDLIDLGLIKDLVLDGRQATITIAFPLTAFDEMHLSVHEFIIQDVTETVESLGLKVNIKTTEMSKEELKKFLAKERETWNNFNK